MLSEAALRAATFAFVCDHFGPMIWSARADPQLKISGAVNLNRAFHPHLMVQECPETANREPSPIREG
jgi:hypothetical protein